MVDALAALCRRADLPRVVEPLAEGRAEVAVADGRLGGWRALAALLLRPISGSADPFSGPDRA